MFSFFALSAAASFVLGLYGGAGLQKHFDHLDVRSPREQRCAALAKD
jgi:hypothetical protein